MLHPIHAFIHRIGRLVLLDRAADPAANGEIQRNATHVKVYSGGAVRNLSDVGAAPAHTLASHSTKAHSELTGIGTSDHHAQLHAAAHEPGGGDAMAVDAAAATGSLRTLGTTALKAAAGDHTHAASGAVTRAGGNTTETTSTSTTAVDLFSVAALSIAALTPWFFLISGRKTSGAATAAGLGLKLNTTVTTEAVAGSNGILWFNATNEAQNGAMTLEPIHGRQTNYLNGSGYGLAGAKGASGVVQESNQGFTRTADFPNATTTDVVIRSITTTSVTVGADELHVYTLSTS